MTDDWLLKTADAVVAADADVDADAEDADSDADADSYADAVTPSSNTRNYTRRSVPSSLGRSFLPDI